MIENMTYVHVAANDVNYSILDQISDFATSNPTKQLYILNTPLGEKKYNYSYKDNVIVILSPKHKIMFIDLRQNQTEFDIYFDDFIEDTNTISDKYNYKNYIGRPRVWRDKYTCKIAYSSSFQIEDAFQTSFLSSPDDQRFADLLISLLIGSINDIERIGISAPETTLDRVKKNIVLFDGDQTRFIYQDFKKKIVSIQGLSGTGKTELLLHKLKDLYTSDNNSTIFFTCHNIALARSLKERVPHFFNFMKVEKQIEWDQRLWVSHAWGSGGNPNSGLYSYLCNFYEVPFMRYSYVVKYEQIFKQILDKVNTIDEVDFSYAFDYILVDERQDFPEVFFELCAKVARYGLYIAGDIFQDIYENVKDSELEVDVMLNRCYRTDPKTLMFAHGIGLGLFEEKKLNWFSDDFWNKIGYQIKRLPEREVHLRRSPIRRFEDIQSEHIDSVVIGNSTLNTEVISIIKHIQENHKGVCPDDIAIILLDDNRTNMYSYIDTLSIKIQAEVGWSVNRGYETKNKVKNSIYISNPNNVKGLEFPFVICITAQIRSSYKERSILYTMLTRSFIQSYLLVQNQEGLEQFREGLKYINKHGFIKTVEPSDSEKDNIKKELLTFRDEINESYDVFIDKIFGELGISDIGKRTKLIAMMNSAGFDKFDKATTVKYIQSTIEFIR